MKYFAASMIFATAVSKAVDTPAKVGTNIGGW